MKNTHLLRLTRLAVLIALQVVLSRFLPVNVGSSLKFSFGFVPVVLAGALEGVPGACLVALLSDLIGATLFPSGRFFIGYTVTAVLSAALYGLFFYHGRTKRSFLMTVLAFTLNALFVTLGLNTLMIAFQYGYLLSETKDLASIPPKFWALLPGRALQAAVMLPVQVALTHLLLNVLRLDTRIPGRKLSAPAPKRDLRVFRILFCALTPVLIAFALCVNLGALPVPARDMAYTRYLATYALSDITLLFAAWALGLILCRFIVKRPFQRSAFWSALVLAMVFCLSQLFSFGSVRFPTDLKRLILVLASFAGALPLFYGLALWAFELLDRLPGDAGAFNWKKAALLIFLCAVPYLLIAFPGTVNADAWDELNQFMGTLYPGKVFSRTAAYSTFSGTGTLINDTQPVLHTLLLGGFYALGRAFGRASLGIFAFVLLQTALFALAAGNSLRVLSQLGLGKKALQAICAFYALFPLFPLYSAATLKETAFAIWLLFSLSFLCEQLFCPEKALSGLKRPMMCALSILLCCLFRSFGALILLPLIVQVLIVLRKNGALLRRALISACGALALFLAVQLALLPLLGVGRGPKVESRSLMVQQTALFVTECPQDVTDEQWRVIEQAFGTRDLQSYYRPDCADDVKYLALSYKGSWRDYDRVWLQMGLKKPGLYLRAALGMAAWYWDTRLGASDSGLVLYLGNYGVYDNGFSGDNPRSTPGYVEVSVSDTNLKLESALKSALLILCRVPPLGLLFKSAPYLMALMLALGFALSRKRTAALFPLVLLLYGLALTLGAQSGFSRYAFPIMLCAPFAVTLSAIAPSKQLQ